ncbi:sulfotransferase family cytosolic 1B member 1-like [Pecten maximus]|uniref:sulfotransferase family cytosolic 1B member 1-like n=1 Tax=Pecten maximus TaxID=6579 RepID=UPI00145822D3|nr:sulfotransferase family cytosolic 1B member 1-like [Pecten maximus]XP_033726251.1 sulfotransferase family cytosolic 1B member 1-like [Pecten maximus]
MKSYEGFNYPYEIMDNIGDHLRHIRDMELRDDDVFITSYPKSGTHWIYEIVYMLLRDHTAYCRKHHLLDVESMDVFNNAPSPRVFITHIPIDRLPWRLSQGRVKVINITRNPKDVVVSHFCFVKRLAMTAFDGEFNYSYVDKFLRGDVPYDSWFRSVLTWEKFPQTHPEVPFLMMNYEDMKTNPRQEIEKVAIFLGKTTDGVVLDEIADKCSFIKTHQDKVDHPDPLFDTFSRDGPQIIYRKGEIGDWKNWFTVADNEKFDQVYKEKMAESNLIFRFSL